MGDRFGFRLIVGIALVAALAAVGFYTYNLGLAHGVAHSGQLVAAPGTTAPVVIWPRPWGLGFGFFPFFPLMILFWIFVARALFWRGAWRGRGCRYDGPRDARTVSTPGAAERTT
jgi:hypothetical protein